MTNDDVTITVSKRDLIRAIGPHNSPEDLQARQRVRRAIPWEPSERQVKQYAQAIGLRPTVSLERARCIQDLKSLRWAGLIS
jgi:hypothetical protein